MKIKLCARCGKELDRLGPYCLPCRAEYRRERKAANPEKVQEQDRRYRVARKPAQRCSMCGSTEDVYKFGRCRPCHRAYMREYTRANADHIRVQERAAHKRHRLEVLAHYGGVCACCGEGRYEFLAIDHINGGGRKEEREWRERHGAGMNLSRRLKRLGMPPGYRVLCHNCNMAYGIHGFCPHMSAS